MSATPELSADRYDVALGGTDLAGEDRRPGFPEPAVRTLLFVYSATGGVSVMSESPVPHIDPELERAFNSLARQWRRETRHISSIHERSMNRAYQKIIALGQAIVPLILRDLENTRDHWLWALDIIQEVNPARAAEDFDEAVDIWLSWGRQHNYLR